MSQWYAKKTLASLLDEAAARWGPCEALYHEGRRWSFAEIAAGVDATARGLITLGIAPGDKVALWMPNRPEWIFAFFALSKIGAVAVPVNTRLRAPSFLRSDNGPEFVSKAILQWIVEQNIQMALIDPGKP